MVKLAWIPRGHVLFPLVKWSVSVRLPGYGQTGVQCHTTFPARLEILYGHQSHANKETDNKTHIHPGRSHDVAHPWTRADK